MKVGMTFTELFIIYLTIGAPFGVYFFLKQRERLFGVDLFVKSIFAALFWFYYALQMLISQVSLLKNTGGDSFSDSSREKEIDAVSQKIQAAFAKLSETGEKPSFFEFRELIERYTGLTLAVQGSAVDSPATAHETEIFRIAGFEKKELQLAGRIQHRKNFLRLQAHERAARFEFLKVCEKFNEKNSSPDANLNGKLEAWQEYQTNVLLLAELLEDAEALRTMRRMFNAGKAATVEANGKREKSLWKTLQPSPALNSLQANRATSSQTIPTSLRD